MSKKQYSAKFKDPRWQKKRLGILERDGWSCQKCGADTDTLHVHHRYYEFGKEPWDYPDDVLVTLCEDCHESEGSFKEDFKIIHHVVAEWCFASDIVPLWEIINSWQEKGKYPPEVILDGLRHFFVLGDGLEEVMKLHAKRLKERREGQTTDAEG